MGSNYASPNGLAAIMLMIMVAVMIPVSVMASCPRIFQVTAAILRLSAVFPVLAFLIVQLTLRIADSLLALSVIVAITDKCPCGNGSAQERQNNERRDERLGFLEHASSSSDCHIHLRSWMH